MFFIYQFPFLFIRVVWRGLFGWIPVALGRPTAGLETGGGVPGAKSLQVIESLRGRS
jgi:hypothetical protein